MSKLRMTHEYSYSLFDGFQPHHPPFRIVASGRLPGTSHMYNMCVYIYIHTHLCIYIYTCTVCIYIYTYMYV